MLPALFTRTTKNKSRSRQNSVRHNSDNMEQAFKKPSPLGIKI